MPSLKPSSKSEQRFQKDRNAIPDSYSNSEDKLFDIFNNPKVSDAIKRKMAEAIKSSTQGYLWLLENLREDELNTFFKNNHFPNQDFELDAYLYNPNVSFAPYEGSSLAALFSRHNRGLMYPFDFDENRNRQFHEMQEYVCSHLIAHNRMTLELAGEILAPLVVDEKDEENLIRFGMMRVTRVIPWPAEIVMEWVRSTYSLEEFPDAFIIEFAQPVKADG